MRTATPARTTDRWHSDAGAGLVSSVAGITVFLAFLLFSVQLLTNLYATSVVTSAVHDGARRAAEAGTGPDDRRAAEAQVRALLGAYGDEARLDWAGTDADVVRLRVQIDNPSFLLRSLPAELPFQHIDRTATVRVERPR
jgi:hypothetical protein